MRIAWRKMILGFLVGAALALFVAWMVLFGTVGELFSNPIVNSLITIVAASITAIATVYIAKFTIVLAGVGQQQIKDTRILQRARISAEMLGINPYLGEGDNVVGHVSFRNVGNLPASNVSWFIRKCIDQSDERREFLIEDAFFGDNIIAPGTPMTQGSVSFERPRVDAGFIYIWGEIRYPDGFNTNRFTRFCHRYNCRTFQKLPERERYGILAGYGRYHEYGNSTDESWE